MPKKKRDWYTLVTIEDLQKLAPAGYKLAKLRVPFSKTLCITWWVDANGRVGREGVE